MTKRINKGVLIGAGAAVLMALVAPLSVPGVAFAAGPAAAAATSASKAAPDADIKKSLILQLFEVTPPRDLVDASIESVAASRYAPDDPDREEFVSRMQLAVDYDRIEALAISYMSEIFTVPELRAMVDYYTSDVGRSIQKKALDYRLKMAPELKKMLDKAVLDTVTSPSPAEAAQINR